ncbi:oligosaccharide flippase family protein [Alteraurantiacibacter aquimixticola]|uniref:Uncharacterized protein n=1 Tax=Alteraurantiacibacter aquimixticola TaxID=2489173 RepID=A0A4T3EWV4_9SPHN|nr:oligosaccharide flippase family protein [Alteraurantiacibacter aquimixticola]TIX48973.1 hypothetical protein E5222_14660 [Alteraurantiacibacter aquimixticola]
MRRNIYSALTAQSVVAVVSLAASIAVARMMQPAEFGVFSIGLAVITLVGVLQRGVGEYLLYAKDDLIETRRSVFGFAFLGTLIGVVAIFASRPLLLEIYESPGVADITMVLPLAMVVILFTMPITNMLAREERFVIINVATAISTIVMSALQVGLVWLGFSYMGLAYATVAAAFAQLLFLIFVAPEHVLLRPSFANMRKIASFGSMMIGSNLLQTMTSQAGQMIIGAMANVSQAALFARAGTVSRLYNQTIPRAIDPLIRARIGAQQRDGLNGLETVLNSSMVMLTVSTAFFGFLAVASDLIVPLVYGEQWAPAAPAMTIIALGLIFWPITSPATAYLTACDRLDVVLRNRIFNLALRVVLLIVLVPYGLEAACLAIMASGYFNAGQLIYALKRYCDTDVAKLLRALIRPFLTGAIPVLITFVAKLALARLGTEGWALLGAIAAVMSGTSLASLFLLKHPLADEIRTLIKRR